MMSSRRKPWTPHARAANKHRKNALNLESLEPRVVPSVSQVVFTTPSQAITEGQASAIMTIQLEDSAGNPVAADPGGITFTLSSTTSTGSFEDAGGNSLAGGQLTVVGGASTGSFKYVDSTWGFPLLKAAAPGLSASQQETIDPNTSNYVIDVPAQVRLAYGINDIPLDGSGQTIAIFGLSNDPHLLQDVDTFDQTFGRTSAGPSLFQEYGAANTFLTVYNENGQASPLPPNGTDDEEEEEALDVEWAHAIAPRAKIDFVEALENSRSDTNIANATAGALPGVTVYSTSWGFTAESSEELTEDSIYTHPNVTYLTASGDTGIDNIGPPSFSPNMVAVGGTNLSLNPDGTYLSEVGWSGSGGGVSELEPEPLYQLGVETIGKRTNPDVALIAGNQSVMAFVDSVDFPSDPLVAGCGTSFAAPMWAGIMAMVDQSREANGLPPLDSLGPTEALEALYSLPAADFRSNLDGDNGSTDSGLTDPARYDEVTGLGTPILSRLIPDLAAYGSSVKFNRNSIPGAQIGTSYLQTIIATGGNQLAVNIKSGHVPAGLTFTTANNVLEISGTATAAGSVTFDVTATDDLGVQATKTYTLIAANALPPTFDSVSNAVFQLGQFMSAPIVTESLGTVALTTSGTLPEGVSLHDNGNGTGSLQGTPIDAIGTFTFDVIADNGGASATQVFTLTVVDPPTFTSDDNGTMTVGSSSSISIATAAGLGTKTTITYDGVLPAGVRLIDHKNGTASLQGKPAANTGGSYTITIFAKNGPQSVGQQPFTLIVNQNPGFTSANGTTFTVATNGTFRVETHGFGSPPAIQETGDLPANVSLTDNHDGTATLSGIPEGGTGKVYPIVIDAGEGITQSFTLTVDEPSSFSSADNFSFAAGSSNLFTIKTSGGFPTEPELSYTGLLPPGVSFKDLGNGTATLRGMPAANSGGDYPITIRLQNSPTAFATQPFTLIVTQSPAIVSDNSTIFAEGKSGIFSISTKGFVAPITIAFTGNLPNNVVLTDNGDGTASLRGIPEAGTAASSPYAITIKASDTSGHEVDQSFTLLVDRSPTITSLNSATFVVGKSGKFPIDVTAGLPTKTELSVVGTLPKGVSIAKGAHGAFFLQGNPKRGSGKVYNFTLVAGSGGPATFSEAFTLTVD
jgi:hypothetical protein